jgi:glycine/D-amino acid oxidase-like deaminating enzyme
MYMLERARERGVRLVPAKVESVNVIGNQVEVVHLRGADGLARLATRHFVIAAGPFIQTVGRMIGVELPVYSEFHTKVAFTDHLGIVPRDAPLLIWADPQVLPWTEDERALLEELEETKWMLDDLPSGVHTRPEGPSGSSILLFVWAYHENPVEPVFPLMFDTYYPELVLRGLATMIPGLKAYIGRAPKPVIDGGYYAKTRENRPLIGPLPVRGAYVIGALSGYGLMASPASGDLLAAHITGSPLPRYAPAFALERYQDPEYQRLLENWGTTGQL